MLKFPKSRVKRVLVGTHQTSGTDVWERWHYGSHYAFYALLALATALAALESRPLSWGALAAMFGLTLLLAVLYRTTILAHPVWVQQRPLPVALYFAGALALFAGLTYLSPAYMLLLFILYWQVWTLWTLRWAIPGVVALTVSHVLWQSSEFGRAEPSVGPGLIIGFAVTLAVSILLALFIDAIIGQSQERRRLIEELETARAELAAEERRAGVLEERSRLAREIHDTLAQGFISITAHLEVAGRSLPSDGAGRRHLEQARSTAREGLTEARRLVRALRPELLESSSLPEALERLVGRFSQESGVPAGVTVAGEPAELPQELQVTLFRAAQEALANARKHAGASLSRFDMTLSYLGDLVLLDAQDDGAGFEPEAAFAADGGFGLAGLRERTERLGGRLVIESTPGEGTTLVVELPVEAGERVSASTREGPA